jgi:hypothetical protein
MSRPHGRAVPIMRAPNCLVCIYGPEAVIDQSCNLEADAASFCTKTVFKEIVLTDLGGLIQIAVVMMRATLLGR